MKTALALSTLVCFAPLAPAGIGVETYGTAAPPTTTGGIWMHSAPPRTDLFADVTSTPLSETGDVIYFSSPVSVRQIGAGWATWSHGYTGNCFYNGSTALTMTLSSGAKAFQFYAEPNPFGVWNITATGSDGSTSIASTQGVEGDAGATGWGFYGTQGSDVASIAVSSDVDFAVGEFAHSWVPAPAGLGVFAMAGLGAARRRR